MWGATKNRHLECAGTGDSSSALEPAVEQIRANFRMADLVGSISQRCTVRENLCGIIDVFLPQAPGPGVVPWQPQLRVLDRGRRRTLP
jgi:hypothetical protein